MIYLLQLHREVFLIRYMYFLGGMFSQHGRTWRAWIRSGMYLPYV